jgi:hypothetical protein
LWININKKARTGKSYLIAVLFIILCNIAKAIGKPMPLAQAAPIGVTAFNINGKTIYNLLRLLVNRPFKELPAASFMPLQQAFKNIHYLTFDKKSIIRQIYLAWINRRLCQIYFVYNNDYFKSLNILLVNNFH